MRRSIARLWLFFHLSGGAFSVIGLKLARLPALAAVVRAGDPGSSPLPRRSPLGHSLRLSYAGQRADAVCLCAGRRAVLPCLPEWLECPECHQDVFRWLVNNAFM